jgi:hypothetical protein
MARLNLSGPELGAIALLWAQREIIDIEGERFNPQEASITIIEGTQIPISGLSLGRGWPIAVREGEEVTERVLAEAGAALRDGTAGVAVGDGDGGSPARGQAAPAPAADPLKVGVELAALLGSDALRLLAAWRAVAARSSGLAPSESLALAEREVRGEAGPPA